MYHNNTHIHFIGIGGIGMSGIALILKKLGYTVSGCDLNITQPSIKNLTTLGICVFQGNNTPQCHDHSINYVVYTSDVPLDHPECHAAAQAGKLVHRSHMLAELMRKYFSIAISGSHGKTTTTSLIAHIMTQACLDPSYVVGGLLNASGTNAALGASHFFVAEADESDRSLLNLSYALAVITNIDREHLNTYRDIQDICATFQAFLSKLPFYGKAILCADDPYLPAIKLPPTVTRITYGFSPHATLQAHNRQLLENHATFDVYQHSSTSPLGSVHLSLPGEHNIRNALAAIAVARELHIPFTTIAAALSTFAGVDRRFTFRGKFQEAEIFDDYGHHPQEIACTLRVARQRARGRLIVVFQPHRVSRTQALWHDFIELFATQTIDHLFITDIYHAFEAPVPAFTSDNLVREINKKSAASSVSYIAQDQDFDALKHRLKALVQPHDLVLFLGAGNVYHIGKDLVKQ